MDSLTVITDLSHIIELSVAPVFLLAAIAGFLSVMSGRLGRIVDRSRVLKQKESTDSQVERSEVSQEEAKILWRRMAIINYAIGFCTTAGLLICLLIICLFLGTFWSQGISTLVVSMFIIAMISLVIALILFLKEVHLTTRTMRIVRAHFDAQTISAKIKSNKS